MYFRRLVQICILILLLGFCSTCSKDQNSNQTSVPRNVYLITATGLRADHLSSYMYQPIQTPGLDFLAYDGVRFTRVYSTSSDSLPAHVSVLTGFYPMRKPVLQIYEYFQTFTSETLPLVKSSLPSLLHEKGYRTAAFAADPELRSFLLRGGWFDRTYAGNSELPSWEPSSNSKEIRNIATEWILSTRGNPHFVLLNFFEPTPSYNPPEPYNKHYENHPYDGEVAALDEQVGHFIHWLKQNRLFERSIVIFAAPYAENPDGMGRAGSVEDRNLKVPLMIAAPGLLPAHQMYETAVTLSDVYPTVLALMKISVSEKVDGIPLFEKNSDRQIVHDHIHGGTLFPLHFGLKPKWFVWSDGWKLISGEPTAKREEGFPINWQSESIRKKEAELRSLLMNLDGNFEGESTFYGKLEQAMVLARSNEVEQGLQVIQDPMLPDTPSILSIRAAILSKLGRFQDAEKVLSHTPKNPELQLQYAKLQLRLGNVKFAAEALKGYQGNMSYDLYSTISVIYRLFGNLQAAQSNAEGALRLNPRSSEAYRQIGLIQFARGDSASAEISLRKSLELEPGVLEVQLELAEVLKKLGKVQEAKRLGATILIGSAAPEIRERARKILAE
ncbi:MAG TPA: sulfatase-like hydrolase/transferase [Acidobacteriota bacterium]|nr:sulfatase-like hydrolase/transferase [Acidobacteriota bacterium]